MRAIICLTPVTSPNPPSMSGNSSLISFFVSPISSLPALQRNDIQTQEISPYPSSVIRVFQTRSGVISARVRFAPSLRRR